MNEEYLKYIGRLYDIIAERHHGVQKGVVERLLQHNDGVTTDWADRVMFDLWGAGLIQYHTRENGVGYVGCGEKTFSAPIVPGRSLPVRDMLLKLFQEIVFVENQKNPLTREEIASVEKESPMNEKLAHVGDLRNEDLYSPRGFAIAADKAIKGGNYCLAYYHLTQSISHAAALELLQTVLGRTTALGELAEFPQDHVETMVGPDGELLRWKG